MTMINGKKWDNVVITIGGVELTGVKSISYKEEKPDPIDLSFDVKHKRSFNWSARVWIHKEQKSHRYDPSLIDVIANGKHHDN